VYLGGFDTEIAAAKAHDVMAIKARGPRTLINFRLHIYGPLLPYLNDNNLERVSVAGQGQGKGGCTWVLGAGLDRGGVKEALLWVSVAGAGKRNGKELRGVILGLVL
jgi:hypothetical protein